jgi:hypothetical protein
VEEIRGGQQVLEKKKKIDRREELCGSGSRVW